MNVVYTDKERRPWYALLVSICTKKSVSESLTAMGIKEGQFIDDNDYDSEEEHLAPNYARVSWMISGRGHSRKSSRGW